MGATSGLKPAVAGATPEQGETGRRGPKRKAGVVSRSIEPTAASALQTLSAEGCILCWRLHTRTLRCAVEARSDRRTAPPLPGHPHCAAGPTTKDCAAGPIHRDRHGPELYTIGVVSKRTRAGHLADCDAEEDEDVDGGEALP